MVLEALGFSRELIRSFAKDEDHPIQVARLGLYGIRLHTLTLTSLLDVARRASQVPLNGVKTAKDLIDLALKDLNLVTPDRDVASGSVLGRERRSTSSGGR